MIDQIMSEHVRKLIHKLAYRYSAGNDELRKDLVQQAYYVLCARVSEYDSSLGTFGTWAFVRIRSAMLRYLEQHASITGKQTLRSEQAQGLAPITFEEYLHSQTDTKSDQLVTELHVKAALAKLTPDQRELLSARTEGYTLLEIAKYRRVSMSHVGRQTERASVRLAALLGKERVSCQ